MNEHADHLATGSVQDFAEYKRMCGIIEGLALAEREMLDWLEQHIKEQELDTLCRAKYERGN